VPPARVVTAPAGVTTRTRLLLRSATHTLPVAASSARPHGRLNCADVPTPSAVPEFCGGMPGMPPTDAAPPASVVTAPLATTTLRTALFDSSATYRVAPDASTATPRGLLNCAAAPAPSAKPDEPLPASDVTAPAGVTTRTLWLPVSATYRLPAASSARPVGDDRRATVPVPSTLPALPPPTNVVTPPVAMTSLRTALFIASATHKTPLAASSARAEGK